LPQMFSFHSGGGDAVGGPMVTPQSAMLEYLQALIDSLPDGEVQVHLFTGDTDPGILTELADYAEADFDGYAAIDVVLTPPAVNPDGIGQADFPTAHFLASGATTPNLVTGFFLTANTGARYLGGQRFPAGVMIDEAGDYIDVDGSLQMMAASQVPSE